ncbi:hypothetical protein [Melghirimyces algeriensis]|uniref:hypothetical protein n=1 Tax=Melghirimyces algeriensis TaxID=910412 RepID=UPI00163DA110|nr:hypothetical protein [Melghirimyces algeriensis]
MEHPFPTTQRDRSQSFSGYFVRWLGPEGMKRTLFHFVAGGKRCGNGYLPFTTLS